MIYLTCMIVRKFRTCVRKFRTCVRKFRTCVRKFRTCVRRRGFVIRVRHCPNCDFRMIYLICVNCAGAVNKEGCNRRRLICAYRL
jgi:hypothetical protein